MPMYEYRCENGHKMDIMCRYEERQSALPCSKCGQEASLGLSAPAGVVAGTSTPLRISGRTRVGYVEEAPGVFVKGNSLDVNKIVDWKCTTCTEKGVAVDEPLPEKCVCGAAVEVYDNPNVRWKDWFPPGGYYDRALGVFLTSRAHRTQVLKEKGLRESDDFEIEDRFRGASAKRAKEDADIKAMLEEWDDDKERQQGVDRGEIVDHSWAKDVMGMN